MLKITLRFKNNVLQIVEFDYIYMYNGKKEWSENNVFNIIVDKSKSCRKYYEWYKNI